MEVGEEMELWVFFAQAVLGRPREKALLNSPSAPGAAALVGLAAMVPFKALYSRLGDPVPIHSPPR